MKVYGFNFLHLKTMPKNMLYLRKAVWNALVTPHIVTMYWYYGTAQFKLDQACVQQ